VLSPSRLSTLALERLSKEFDKRNPSFNYSKTEDKNPDVRHDTRLQLQGTSFYASMLPFNDSPSDTEVDWAGVRGWFDECVRVGRRRGWDDGFFWTGHGEKYRDEIERRRNEPLDSYYGHDCTSWEFIQQERDEELRIDGEEDVELPLIDGVIHQA
jgi:hypothetical protein